MADYASDRLMRRKIALYLLPTLGITAAFPIAQVVDSLFIAFKSGSGAMAAMNLAYPYLLLAVSIFSFFGSGGAAEYAAALSAGDEIRASRALRETLLLVSFLGLLLLGLSLLLYEPLSRLFCRDSSLMKDFQSYFSLLIYSAPLIIVFLTLTELLVPAGKPAYAFAAVFMVLLLRTALDYLYIDCCNLGIKGAAVAQLVSCLLGISVTGIGVLIYAPQIQDSRAARSFRDIRDQLLRICRRSNPEGVAQLGMAAKLLYTFSLSHAFLGTDAVVAFALGVLIASVFSAVQGAMIGTAMPLIAVFFERRNYRAVDRILKYTLITQFVLSLFLVVLFLIFTRPIIALFQITDESQVAMCITVLRVYMLSYLFRGGYTLFRSYVKFLHLKRYGWLLSAVALSMTGVYVLCTTLGGAGLWWANPISSLGLLVFTVLGNRMIYLREKDRWANWLLIPRDDQLIRSVNVSVENNSGSFGPFVRELDSICLENGLSRRDAWMTAFAVEDLLLNLLEHRGGKGYTDISARLYEDRVEIDFCSLGSAYQVEEMQYLQKISSELDHQYIAGMNCTRITMRRQSPCPR